MKDNKLKLRTTPFPHQRTATARAVAQGSHAFFMEPRCGKTKAALDAIAVLNHRGVVRRVVVIAPLTVLSVWEAEIRSHMSVPCYVKTVGEAPWLFYPGPPKKKEKPLDLVLYLINYDKYSRRGEDEVFRNPYTSDLERWNPDVVVLDESHRVKSAGAVRSQALWRMVARLRKKRGSSLPYVYLLTGTPNPKGYIDLFSQLRIMDEGVFGTSKAGFEDEYCIYGQGRGKHTVVRYRSPNRILQKVRRVASIVTAEEANLAGREFFNPIPVQLPPSVRRSYDELVRDFITFVAEATEPITAANAGVLRLRLLQLTGGFTTDGTEIHRSKLAATRDLLEDLYEQRENVVVYARFIPEVLALEQIVRGAGYAVGTIRGKTRRKERADYVQRFQTDASRPQALVFQVMAGALGLDLSAAAETLYYSLPDSWEAFFQSTRRVHGVHQTRPVRHTLLLADHTVDHSVLETLRGRKDMHKSMMGNLEGFLRGL